MATSTRALWIPTWLASETGLVNDRPTRHQLGQWFTPAPVADLALALALAKCPSAKTLLDPSCGDGVFLARAKEKGFLSENLLGVDLDPEAIDLARLGNPSTPLLCKDYFEFFSEGRFDLIVGNPPYVRQERLSAEQKTSVLNALREQWQELPPRELEKLVGRGDLAAPFLLRALGMMHGEGRAAFVVSSALLDSAYGAQLWKLLSKLATVELIVDAPKEEWFAEAAVHTLIVVLRSGASSEPVHIGRLQTSTQEAALAIAAGKDLSELCDVREAAQDRPDTWAGVLRAPDVWLEFVRKARGALIPLSEVASVRRGITSGANDIFYLSREQAQGLPDRFLSPILRSPSKQGLSRIEFDSANSSQKVLMGDGSEDWGHEPAAAEYLADFPLAPLRKSLAARSPWWQLKARPSQVFLCKSYANRFVQPFSQRPVFADQRLYCVQENAGLDPQLLSAILNATPSALALESLGRASMGQGVLEWSTADLRSLPILDPRSIKNADVLRASFKAFRTIDQPALGPHWDSPQRIDLDRALLSNWPELLVMREGVRDALRQSCIARNVRGKR